ncbi:MAG: triose-phosphate isomerase, partial [bacterium]
MRKPVFGGNWKMNKTVKESIEMVKQLKEEIGRVMRVEVAIFPPFTSLWAVKKVLEDSPIGLGAQNMYWEEKGAYTGEVSPLMLLDAGCKYVILGHSERRQYFGETDARVNQKIKAALSLGLTPLVCVGEILEERKAGRAEEVVESQMRKCLEGLNYSEAPKLIIAYEPVWAIGTGKIATPGEAQRMHSFIRDILEELWGKKISSTIRIQYGGSVKPENIKDL